MTRAKPGRVARIPDSVAEQWDGLFEIARREAAARRGDKPEDVPPGRVWSEIVEVLTTHYCGTEHRQIMTVDAKLDMVLNRLDGLADARMDGRIDPMTEPGVEGAARAADDDS